MFRKSSWLPLLVFPFVVTMLSVTVICFGADEKYERIDIPESEPVVVADEPFVIVIEQETDAVVEAAVTEVPEIVVPTEPEVSEVKVDTSKTKYTEEEVMQLARDCEEEFGIDPYILTAAVFRESTYQSNVENGGCQGFMQVSPKWHKDRMKKLGVSSLYDPVGNLRVASDYLMELLNKYDGNMVKALRVYHGESGETSHYAYDILAKAEELKEHYE